MKAFFALLIIFSRLFANEGETLFNAKCRVCHGNLADRPAYNASSIIAGWNIEKTIHALQGYRLFLNKQGKSPMVLRNGLKPLFSLKQALIFHLQATKLILET